MSANDQKITALSLSARKQETGSPKIVAVTAYDYTLAKLFDEAVDVVLVGDSLGMVVQGESNTLSVTLEQMIYHSRIVAKAIRHSHLVADMPFMTYQTGIRDALRNAGRLISEGRAEAVKVEGGVAIAKTVEALTESGIPVLGHVGLTPQSVLAMGGYRIQGKTESAKEAIIQDARALEDAGAYAVVLEGIPADLAQTITSELSIPTIGIGAGPHCDGQILVGQDLLGMFPDFRPRFVKVFAEVGQTVAQAAAQFAEEVRNGSFPDREHSF
jgi:3-methyl-2-oxobutanoate hydroxymethyltransferase